MPTKRNTPRTTKDSQKPYSAWLEKVASMRGQAGIAAFDRASLLVQVFDDAEWREKYQAFDDLRLASVLDAYVEDLCVSFLQLRSLLEHYPKREQWVEGKLATMREAMLEDKHARSTETQPVRSRATATVAELKAAKDEARRWRNRGEQLQARQTSLADERTQLRDRITELEEENRQLQEENTALKAELEGSLQAV